MKKRKEWTESQAKMRRRVLRSAIAKIPPPSTQYLYEKYGKGFEPRVLQRNEAELIEKLNDARARYENVRIEKFRKILLEALGEVPVPAMSAVARRAGCDIATLRKHHRALIDKIAERSRHYRREMSLKRREDLEAEILAITKELIAAGVPPRKHCIIPMLGEESLKAWDAVGKAIKKAWNTLGLKPSHLGSPSQKHGS